MKISRFLRRLLLPVMLLLSAFSPLVFFLANPVPQYTWPLMIFPAAYAALALLLITVPGRTRMPLFAAGCALCIAAGFYLFPQRLSLLAMPILGGAALFLALSYADKGPAEISPFFYVVTLMAHLATLFLLHTASDPDAAHDALRVLIQSGFVVYMLLLLLSFSRISLNNATLSRYRLPAIISRVSTTLTVCFFVLALALSSLPAVISGVYFVFRMLRDGVVRALVFLIELLPSESMDGMQGGPMPMMLPGISGMIEQEPSLFTKILEKAAEIFTLIVVIVGTLLLLRLLVRLIVLLARHLLERLQHYAAAVTEDYEDEITDTREEGSDRSFHLLRLRRDRRRAVYPDTPAGEIRRSYARLMNAHKEWADGSTARENLPDAAASLYERARYSDHPVTQQDAGFFHQETRRL